MNISTGIKYHKLPIYPYAVLFCMGSSFEDIVAYLKIHTADCDLSILKEEYFSEDFQGYTVLLKDINTVVVWVNEECLEGYGIITHEVFHAVEFIMDSVGIIHCAESSEAFAYLLTYLINELEKK